VIRSSGIESCQRSGGNGPFSKEMETGERHFDSVRDREVPYLTGKGKRTPGQIRLGNAHAPAVRSCRYDKMTRKCPSNAGQMALEQSDWARKSRNARMKPNESKKGTVYGGVKRTSWRRLLKSNGKRELERV